jgi:hypothetical protein
MLLSKNVTYSHFLNVAPTDAEPTEDGYISGAWYVELPTGRQFTLQDNTLSFK